MFIDIAQPFVLPPYWLNHPVRVLPPDTSTPLAGDIHPGQLYQCPLSLRVKNQGEFRRLPLDPVIGISLRNSIVTRNVLKAPVDRRERRGSVKELWTTDDYQVTIAGVIIDSRTVDAEQWLRFLRQIGESRSVIEVENPVLTVFNIRQIAIQSIDFPFTKGLENHMYTINALSDDDFDLLINQ